MNLSHVAFHRFKKIVFWVSWVFSLTVFVSGAVKLKNGSESSLKLSDCIMEYCKLEVDCFKSATGIYTENTLPRFLLTGFENPKIFFYNGTRLIQFDYNASKILNSFPVSAKNLRNILPGSSADKIYLSGEEFSQFDFNTGKIDWTKNLMLQSVYHLYVGGAPYFFRFPIVITNLPDNKLLVQGLVMKSMKLFKSGEYTNKVMILDSQTGDVVSESEFHFRRRISSFEEIFINADTWEYEIYDTIKWGCISKGKLKIGDLPEGKNYTAVDKIRLSPDIIYNGSEFCACYLDNGFIITSRDCYAAGLMGGIKTSKWVIYDRQGNNIKNISPAPLTSIDYRINNLGNDNWPVYMPNTMRRKMRRTRVDKLIALQKDGSYAEIELPNIEGIEEFLFLSVQNWFHKGDTFYYTKDGNLYTFKLGEKTGQLLYKADKSDACETVEAWDSKYLMLRNWMPFANKKNAVLIRFSDGKKIAPEEYNENLDTILWKHIIDFNQSALPLPVTDVTRGFKSYMNYSYGRDFEGRTKISNQAKFGQNKLMFKVWGNYRLAGKYGDIGIVPATMTDKSVALVGIDIADNKPLFSVPVLEFSGIPIENYYQVFPERRYLPFNIIKLNEDEALLMVLEKIDLLKVYKIKRPS